MRKRVGNRKFIMSDEVRHRIGEGYHSTRQAMHYDVTLRRVRVTIFVVVKREVIQRVCVFSLCYPTCKVNMTYFTVVYELSLCTIFFHIISQMTRLTKKIIEYNIYFLS
jgi:hypothetical protein